MKALAAAIIVSGGIIGSILLFGYDPILRTHAEPHRQVRPAGFCRSWSDYEDIPLRVGDSENTMMVWGKVCLEWRPDQ